MAHILHSASEITPNDRIIAVMGPTGSGKSHLIDCLTKSTNWAGDTLQSVTQAVRAVRIDIPGWKEKLVLVDTPGFDDTNRSDVDVLTMIAEWLHETYKSQIKLTGIFYLHRITDVRMSEAPQRNLCMFGKICGSSFAKRVLFVTTMWDKVLRPRGEEREEELRERYLKPMLKLGARMVRFDQPISPLQWVCQLLVTEGDERPALIQEEMVDLGMDINETRAARTLQVRLQEALAEHKKAIENGSGDPEKLNKQIKSLEKDLDKLKISVMKRIQLFLFKRPKGRSVDLAGTRK